MRLTLLLAAACSGAPDTPAPADTDPVDSDPADTDPTDTDLGPVEIAPGIFRDESSPTWRAVADQSAVCQVMTRDQIQILQIGMDDGTVHRWWYGAATPMGVDTTFFGNSLSLDGEHHLLFTRYTQAWRLDLRTGAVDGGADIGDRKLVSYGDVYTNGASLWRGWDTVGDLENPWRSTGQSPSDPLVTDGTTLYLRDGQDLVRFEGSTDMPERFAIPDLPRSTVLTGAVIDFDLFLAWDGPDRELVITRSDPRGSVLHTVRPEGVPSNVQGLVCQAGPLR